MTFAWRSSIVIIAPVDPLMELYLHFNTVKLVINTGVDYRGHMHKIGVN